MKISRDEAAARIDLEDLSLDCRGIMHLVDHDGSAVIWHCGVPAYRITRYECSGGDAEDSFSAAMVRLFVSGWLAKKQCDPRLDVLPLLRDVENHIGSVEISRDDVVDLMTLTSVAQPDHEAICQWIMHHLK